MPSLVCSRVSRCWSMLHRVIIVTCLLSAGCREAETSDTTEELDAEEIKSSIGSVKGLLGHWSFDGDFADSSPRGHNGDPLGKPGFSKGVVGQAIELDGRSQCVEIPSLGVDLDQFTLAFWMYVDGMPAPQTFVAIYHNNGWEAGDVHLPFTSADGTMDLGIKANEPDMSVPTFKVTELQQRWVHVAVSYDAAESNQVRFYLDGALTDAFTIETANKVQLGPGRIGGWDIEERWFLGRLDDVWFFDRALAEDEVADLYRRGEGD